LSLLFSDLVWTCILLYLSCLGCTQLLNLSVY
jgi:hypothetical protein